MIFPALVLAAAVLSGGTPVFAHHPVSTADPQSQGMFDRGLTLFYAYNGTEGVHVFQALERREPSLAMAYWGEALSDGPDINTPLTQSAFDAAHVAIEKAVPLEGNASASETAYINAMRLRFSGPWKDHARAQSAYRKAMSAAVAQFPDDDDLAALEVEALIEDDGLALWKDGTSLPATNDASVITAILDRIIARNPQHIMANHLMTHVFEYSADRSRAVTAAQKLDAMSFAPEDEHLAHMPAHTWIDIGAYGKGVTSSKRAIALFDTYLSTPGIDSGHSSYIWHDIRVAWGASLMSSSADAESFARRLDANPSGHMPFEAFTAMRFGRWTDTTGAPKNAADPLHFAFAYSKLERGDARGALAELSDALDTKAPSSYFLYALRGAAALLQHDSPDAEKNFKKAVALEKSNFGGENLPFLPTAELMGESYFKAGDYPKAMAAYQSALQLYPQDPFALMGLAATMQKLVKSSHAR